MPRPPDLCTHGWVNCAFCGHAAGAQFVPTAPMRARGRRLCAACGRRPVEKRDHCGTCRVRHWRALRLFGRAA